MIISCECKAKRKLAQIGYYRLSGYWFPCRQIARDGQGNPQIVIQPHMLERLNQFEAGTDFESIIRLYLFDKKLRLLLLDAIERIEIFFKNLIAHDLGRLHAEAHTQDSFIHTKFIKNGIWSKWQKRAEDQLGRHESDSYMWHRRKGLAMPIWVATESWDFGQMSKYFSLLKGTHQNRLARQLDINNSRDLIAWLREINTLRNQCAHHARVWNLRKNQAMPLLGRAMTSFEGFERSQRLLVFIDGISYLLSRISHNSEWSIQMDEHLKTFPKGLPNCSLRNMGGIA